MGETKTPLDFAVHALRVNGGAPCDHETAAHAEAELHALREDRASIDAMTTLLACARTERDEARAALTEKDQEIERLKAEAVKMQDGYSRANMDLTLQLSASQAREREAVTALSEAREALAIVQKRWFLECEKIDCLETELSASRAREREAVEAHLRTIDQRDAAEDALSDAFRLVTGREPEWSNLFGYADAKEEITASLDQKESALAAARKALEEKEDAFLARLAEAMEHHPMGNGFDRHDWLDEFSAALNGDSHEPTHKRVWTGPGELERSDYIDPEPPKED